MKTKNSKIEQTKVGNRNGSSIGFFESYRMEPALMAHMLSTLMIFIVVQDFLAERVCRVNLGFSEAVCEAVNAKSGVAATNQPDEYHFEKLEVQRLIGQLMMVRTILENIFPLFLVIMLGAWSDIHGRKYPLLFVAGAFILQNIGLLICTYLPDVTGGWTIAILTSLIPGLSGNNAAFNMAAFSFIVGRVPPETRTSRTGIAHSVIFLGATIGIGLGGVLSGSTIGHRNIFWIGVFSQTLIFIYILLTIREEGKDKGFSWSRIWEIFDLGHLQDALRAVTKSRPGNTQLKLRLLLLSYFCAFAPIMGEITVFFIFGRYKFNWDGSDIGAFLTFRNVIGFIGNFINLGILSQRFGVTDSALGIIACLSAVICNVYYASVSSSHLMYLGPILGLLAGANLVVPRSILSKIIPASELGKVNSFLGCIDSVSPLIAGPLYTIIYGRTIEYFPGAFFLVSGIFSTIPLMVYMYLRASDSDEKLKTKSN